MSRRTGNTDCPRQRCSSRRQSGQSDRRWLRRKGRWMHRIRLLRERIRNNRLRRLRHSSRLQPVNRHATCSGMYVVTEADAAAIKEAYETGGELSAAVELRRRFPGIIDNTTAREQARRIAEWLPLPEQPVVSRRTRKRKAAS